MKHTEQELKINLSDASVDIWLEKNEEKSLLLMMKSISSMLSKNGWSIHTPFEDHLDVKERHGVEFWRSRASKFRKGINGGLEVELYVCGCHLEVKFFENVNDHSEDNRNGGKYIFNKESKMPYLLRMMTKLAKIKITSHLLEHYNVAKFSRRNEPVFTPQIKIDIINKRISESPHYRKELDRADYSDYNRTSANGTLLEEYQTVYTRDHNGRWCVGYTRYSLNYNWYVITGRHDSVMNGCGSIHTDKPEDLRTRDTGNRRRRLEQVMAKAVKLMDFDKAKVIKSQLFGSEPLFMIKKGDLYYGPCGSGYTSSDIDAGKYTEEEAKHYRNDDCLKIIPLYK